jgi:putative hydrolase of the HAD superfamily
MSPTAVIFDLFGTLVDDFVSPAEQMHTEMAAALGVPYQEFLQLWGQTLEKRSIGVFETVEANLEHVCGLIGVRPEPEQMSKTVEIRLRYIREALKPSPDAVATLTQLKNASYKLGLLSNCSVEIPLVWPETALANLFDAAVFSCRACLKKPDPRIYSLACERLGVTPDRCLYVADGENYELAAAANVGLHPVLIRNSSRRTRSDLHREAQEWQGLTISRLTEVLTLVG